MAVEGTKIASVGTEPPEGTFDRVVDGAGKVLLPGFVNAHTHLPMTLMRGYGGGCDLHTWLNQYIFPAEARLDSRAVAAGAGLGLAEMIASGVTCVADMYMHTGTIAEQILEAGISANLSCGGVYFGAPEDFSPETCGDCRNQAALTEEWHGAGAGQILVDASVHGEYTSNPPLWRWMAEYAAEHRLGMHVHVSETQSEHQASLERWGKTPIQALDGCGCGHGPLTGGPLRLHHGGGLGSHGGEGDLLCPQPLVQPEAGLRGGPIPAMMRESTWPWAPMACPPTTVPISSPISSWPPSCTTGWSGTPWP